MSRKQDRHEFAFYLPDLSSRLISLDSGSCLYIADDDLFHRMMHVVRLTAGDSCLLFDRDFHVLIELLCFSKKGVIEGRIKEKNKNNQPLPPITFLLPLLKRNSFEDALYSLVELGATIIQPVFTSKIQRKWGGKKEYERGLHIMSAAAEQSKNFAFSLLKEPVFLPDALEAFTNDDEKIFFDASGENAIKIINRVCEKNKKNIVLFVGPEGDLDEYEKLLLHKHGFSFCALTPTVLRAVQAISLSIGMIRSVCKN